MQGPSLISTSAAIERRVHPPERPDYYSGRTTTTSGLDSWEAVPSSPFELDLVPGFFTGGFGLKGAEVSMLLDT